MNISQIIMVCTFSWYFQKGALKQITDNNTKNPIVKSIAQLTYYDVVTLNTSWPASKKQYLGYLRIYF